MFHHILSTKCKNEVSFLHQKREWTNKQPRSTANNILQILHKTADLPLVMIV